VFVTDLDNTLWGGTIGDDSVDGIAFGPDTASGEAYFEYALWLKALRDRGVTLAVCSKNDRAVAATGFDHPAMPLKVSDFAAFECSFEPKAEALRRIASTLNVGLDSLVFADDDPVERALVATTLPEVSVIDMSCDPALFTRRIARLALFDQFDLTAEDLSRASTEEASRLIGEASVSGGDLTAFLEGLAIHGEVRPPAAAEIARVDQLFRKTNQFNLTQAVWDASALEDAELAVLVVNDRLAHYGIVAAVRFRIEGDAMLVDNWVLSCRVFSRTVEHFILNELARLAAERGARRIRGDFKLSKKNVYARKFLTNLGLLAGESWSLDLSSFTPLATHVSAERAEAA
jgi:FkbH-like protein